MSAPDRSATIMALCAAHPEVFDVPPEQNDSSRLAFLQSTILPELNRIDGGQWGLLGKGDQGNKIPCDIVVWHPTLEHFDVMTGTGGSWQPRGVVANPAWSWQPAPGAPAAPPPPPPPPHATDIEAVLVQLQGRLDARLDRLEQKVDSGFASVNERITTAARNAERSTPALVDEIVRRLRG